MGALGEYMVIGLVFPVALVGGFFLGRWIGGFFGGPTAGALTGLFLGTAAAFYNLWETLQRIQRREAEDARQRALPGEDARQRALPGEDARQRALPGEDARKAAERPEGRDG